MNRRGFTLIELLAVIVLIGLLGVLIVPGLLNNVDTTKENAYNTMIKNIVIASKMYYQECEYGDLSDNQKYDGYACEIKDNTIETTLGALANTGFLNVRETTEENGTMIKVVYDPKTNKDISGCKIKISKEFTNAVTYTIENISGDNCPGEYQQGE